MTTKEFWLTKLAEELGEAQKDVFKAITFGPNDKEPGQNSTNLQRLTNELVDIAVVIQLLEDECGIIIDTDLSPGYFESILARKKHYYQVSKDKGIVKD